MALLYKTHLDICKYNICMHIWSWVPHLCATRQPVDCENYILWTILVYWTIVVTIVLERPYTTSEPLESPGRPSSNQERPSYCLRASSEPRETMQEKTFTRNILWHLCNCDIYLCYCVPLNSPWLITGLFEIHLLSFHSSSILFSFRFCTRD